MKSKKILVNELHALLKRKTTKRRSKKSTINKYRDINNVNVDKINVKEAILNTNEEINKETLADKEDDIKEEKENQNEQKAIQEIMNEYKSLTPEELNDLDYEIAVVIDKRTYWQLYIS